VHIHPTVFTGGRIATQPAAGSPVAALEPSLLEFVFDTTRAAANLMVSGTLNRYRDVRLILAHAGGTVPYLRSRILDRRAILRAVRAGEDGAAPPPTPERLRGLMEAGLLQGRRRLRALYYDTALSTDDALLRCLNDLAPSSHILLGTDFPFAQDVGAMVTIDGLRRYEGFLESDRRAIEGGNALALFPRLDPPIRRAA